MYQGYIKFFSKILLIHFILIFSLTVCADEPYTEGKHYKKIPAEVLKENNIQELMLENKDKIQVIEFFSYACFWCHRLHPLINDWVKKQSGNIIFNRFPIIWHSSWESLAKAYYVVKLLGKSEIWDMDFFKAVQVDHINLSDEKILKKFFIDKGVAENEFNELYSSFAVNKEYKKADELSKSYKIEVSPALIVITQKGSYLLTATMAQSEEGLFKILEYIIERDSKK